MSSSSFSPTIPIGYGVVVPGSTDGLVSSSGLPGNTTGSAIAAGYVGEVIETTSMTDGVSIGADALWSGSNLALTAGVWKLFARIQISSVIAGDAFVKLRITDNAGTTINRQETRYRLQNSDTYFDGSFCFDTVVSTSAAETYKIYAEKTTVVGSATITLKNAAGLYSSFYALRIA